MHTVYDNMLIKFKTLFLLSIWKQVYVFSQLKLGENVKLFTCDVV